MRAMDTAGQLHKVDDERVRWSLAESGKNPRLLYNNRVTKFEDNYSRKAQANRLGWYRQ